MSDLPVSYTSAGPVPYSYSELRAMLIAAAIAENPGLTTELPGSLIEDLASTATGALLSMDQMRIDLINSVGPLTANEQLLDLLAQQYGIVPQKTQGLTTVSVVFTGTPRTLIPEGYQVSDGAYVYSLTEPVIIRDSGTTAPVVANGTVSGQWTVAANTVTTIVSDLPNGQVITVNNPTAGTPGADAETVRAFRQRVWDAGMVTVQGYPGFIRTLVNQVANIDPRQTSVVQRDNGWVVMAGGGDTVDIAAAIFRGAGDITRLHGSTLNVTGISAANPGVVTTDITHGFSDGQVIYINGTVGMDGVNGSPWTITVIDPHRFSLGVSTVGEEPWVSGGVVTPNLRNQSIVINDWPDNYTIPFAVPFQQLLTVTFRWAIASGTTLTSAAIETLVNANVIAYINTIFAGQPLNIGRLRDIFMQSVNPSVDMSRITTLDVVVTVNGTITQPDNGTQIISGDPFSYWYIDADGVNVDEA